MSGTVKVYNDFSGGLHTDTPNSFMPDNALSIAENCYWNNGLVMRKGFRATHKFDGETIIGFLCSGISGSDFDYVVTKSDEFGVILNVCGDYDADITRIPLQGISTFESSVKMVEFAGMIVVVGRGRYSKVSIIKYGDGVHYETTIDEEDTRTREKFEWYAGRADGTTFTDDSVSAQAGLWNLATASGNGFYISSDLVFNSVEISGITGDLTSASQVTIEYSKGDSWVSAPIVYCGVSGDVFGFEFDLPFNGSELDFEPCSLQSPLNGVYVVKVTIDFSGTPPSGIISSVKNTQYFKQMTGNEFPNDVEIYRSMLCISFGNVVNFSPVDSITGWRADDIEIFIEGGSGISRLLNYRESMLVFKPRAIYSFTGNSMNNPTVSRMADIGTDSPDSVVAFENSVMFVSGDRVMIFDGLISAEVGKHIKSTLRDNMALSPCAIGTPEGNYLIACQTGFAFQFSPFTVHQNAIGDYVVSAFVFTNHRFSGMAKRESSRTFVAWYGDTFYTLFEDETDNGNVILLDAETKRIDFGIPGVRKRFFRFKPLGVMHGDPDAMVLVELMSEEDEIASIWFEKGQIDAKNMLSSIPYNLDGESLKVRFKTYSSTGASIQGFAVDMKGGRL